MEVVIFNYAQGTKEEHVVSDEEQLLVLLKKLTLENELECISPELSMAINRSGSGYTVTVTGKTIPENTIISVAGEEINMCQTTEILIHFFRHQILHTGYEWVSIKSEEEK